uniref:Nucleosome assembly protein n=1 Tax=Eutreptiella gymnastica TaxID=73025 RepID=A0A6U7XDM5_9EUGL
MPGRKKPVKDDDDDLSDVEEIDAGDAFETENQGDEMDMAEQLRRLMDPEYAEKFVATLDPVVQTRVRALQGMQADINEIRKKYDEEHKALEKKYEALYNPFFAKRFEIVSGEREPTDEEVKKGQGEDFEELEGANELDTGRAGIDRFWLTAMNHHPDISEMITERDEECLKELKNVTVTNNDDPDTGFVLAFHFMPNPFFTNEILTKTYHLIDEDELVLDHAEGCTIDWKPGQNLTVEVKKKQQKAKKGKTVRTITKEEPCESFFNFFKPPQPDDEDEEDDEDELGEQIEELIEQDYEIGCYIKDTLIPKAVLWYTGEAKDPDDFDDDDDDDEDDMDDDDDDDSEDEPPKKGGRSKKANSGGGEAPPQPECKQQ